MKASTQLLLATASIVPTTLAWGDLGHETIAYIASNFGQSSCLYGCVGPALNIKNHSHKRIVTSATETYFQNILSDTSSSYLANVATWVKFHLKFIILSSALTMCQADTYKYTSAGLFSKPYHFIDAQDKPTNRLQC